MEPTSNSERMEPSPHPSPEYRRGRKEIIQVSGNTIVIMMIVLGDLFVAGIGLWSHHIVLFRENLRHERAYEKALSEQRKIKNEIVALEGVPNWESTTYAKRVRDVGTKPVENTAATGAL